MTPGLAQRSMVSASQAAAILEVDRKTFLRFVAEGRFTTQTLPGMQTRFLRSDVEAFRDRHITRAAAPAEAVTS